jgi:DNA primase
MRFSAQFLDELRARLPVSEVVGRRVKLRKAGREWKGLSPFNKEKTPSFFVNDQKMAWFDFSSGKNGNIFDFVMQTEGVSFPEAVERLAHEAGLPLPKVSYEDEAREQRRKTLHDVVELAAKFFEATLASRAGARARGYLADRGIDPATQVKFRLGYAPAERFALKEQLGKEGVSVEDMVAAGLLISGDDIPVPFDRFRDRVIFPISDLRGRVIAFGGRTMEKDAQPKYLNSPETPLFHKGATLYNIANARLAAHNAGQSAPGEQNPAASVIAVEGYVDVIAMASAGFEATVAPLGTALTAEQLALVWKMADEPVLCFDGDSAGRRAAYRAVDIALPLLRPGKSLRFATLPEGNDPDDLVRSGGREAAAELIGGARPLADVLWTRETESNPIDTPERRAALEARLGEVTATIGDDTVRKYYRQDFGARLRNLLAPAAPQRGPQFGGRSFGGGNWGGERNWGGGRNWSDRKPQGRGGFTRRPQAQPLVGGAPYVVASPQLAAMQRTRASIPRRESLILQAALNHPWLLHDHLEDISSIEFRNPDAEKLKLALIDIAAHDGAADGAAMREELIRRGLADQISRVEKAITTVSVWGAQPEAGPEDVLMTWNQLIALHRQWYSLLRELKDAEQALGRETTEANYSWLQDVKARMSVIDGTEALIEGFGAASGRTAQTL